MLESVMNGRYPLHMDRGRDVAAGNLRGWGLEQQKLQPSIGADPIWQLAREAASARRSVMVPDKLVNLYLIIRYAIDAPKVNIIEFGSFSGGSAVFMATLLKGLGRAGKVYALDTFEGMPTTDGTLDLHAEGDFKDCDYAGLKRYIKDNDLPLETVQGTFEDTLPKLLARGLRFDLAHCDCDIYSGVKYVSQQAEAVLNPGGHLVFDDPLHGSCLGAFTAVEEEMIQRRGLHAEQVYPHLVYRVGEKGKLPSRA